MTPLQEAWNIIANDREETYGDPGVNIRRIAALWSAYLGTPLTAADVCWMMVLHKASRAKHKPDHTDNETDAIGYIALIDRMRGKGEEVAEPDPQPVPELETVEVGDTWWHRETEALVTVTKLDQDLRNQDTVWLLKNGASQPFWLYKDTFLDSCYNLVSRKEALAPVIEVGSVWTNGYLHQAVVTCVGDWCVTYKFPITGKEDTLLKEDFLKRFTPVTDNATEVARAGTQAGAQS
jgi:hypothetical protein